MFLQIIELNECLVIFVSHSGAVIHWLKIFSIDIVCVRSKTLLAVNRMSITERLGIHNSIHIPLTRQEKCKFYVHTI